MEEEVLENTLDVLSKRLKEANERLQSESRNAATYKAEKTRLQKELEDTLNEVQKTVAKYESENRFYKQALEELGEKADEKLKELNQRKLPLKLKEQREVTMLRQKYALLTDTKLALVYDFYVNHISLVTLSQIFDKTVLEMNSIVLEARNYFKKHYREYDIPVEDKEKILKAFKEPQVYKLVSMDIINKWLDGMTVAELSNRYNKTPEQISNIIKEEIPGYTSHSEEKIVYDVKRKLRALEFTEFSYDAVRIISKLYGICPRYSRHLVNLYLSEIGE